MAGHFAGRLGSWLDYPYEARRLEMGASLLAGVSNRFTQLAKDLRWFVHSPQVVAFLPVGYAGPTFAFRGGETTSTCQGEDMLVLTRKLNESIMIDNSIRVTIVGLHGNQVRIGIEAPPDVKVHREEVLKRIMQFAVASSHQQAFRPTLQRVVSGRLDD